MNKKDNSENESSIGEINNKEMKHENRDLNDIDNMKHENMGDINKNNMDKMDHSHMNHGGMEGRIWVILKRNFGFH